MKLENESSGIWAMDLAKWILIGSLALFVIIFAFYGYTEESIRHEIRWSARISFTLFNIAFAASAIHHFLKNSFSWWLRMNRKYFGISFAVVHLMHLIFIISLQYSFHPVFNNAATISLIGGSIAYFFIVTMLMTSFESISRYISSKLWKVIHIIGGYWIWTVFLTTYWKRTDEPVHWLFVAVLVLVLVLRMAKLTKSRLNSRPV